MRQLSRNSTIRDILEYGESLLRSHGYDTGRGFRDYLSELVPLGEAERSGRLRHVDAILARLNSDVPPDPPEYPSLELVVDILDRQLDGQVRQADSLDTKAGLLVGFLSISTAALVQSKDILQHPSTALKAAEVAIALSILLSLSCLRLRKYHRPPRPRTLRLTFPTSAIDTTRLQLSDIYVEAYEANEQELDKKTGFLEWAIRSTAIGAVLLAIHLVLGG